MRFQWQAKNEKILYYKRENLFHYLLRELTTFFVILWVALFVSFLIYVFVGIFVAILVFFIILFLGLFYLFYLHHKTYVIITNKRILKFVRNGLFSEHMKELKLDQLNEVSSAKQWIIEKLFQLWNIKIVWKDKENVIWFQWVKYPKEVVLYISRLRDYVVVENPNYNLEDIKPFIPRKKRKA